jgi:nucleotide-binding universal stress UspA family protein
MKNIIAPIDFSETAENAAIFAGNLAAFYGADLWLYHTYEITIPVSSFGYPFISPSEMHYAAEHELEEYKARVQSAIRTPINIYIRAEDSSLTDGLASLCDEIKPDMVVMGITGKNALARLVVGSNTIKIIQHLTYPVLVVPPKAEFIPIRKIGFACDYEKVIVTTPIEPLKKLVHDFNATLFVLNIVFSNITSSADKIEESMDISNLLKEFKPEYHTILTEDVVYGINWFADKQKLDLVVVMPKKNNLLEKIFSRNKTKDLLYHTHIPVLCMHE